MQNRLLVAAAFAIGSVCAYAQKETSPPISSAGSGDTAKQIPTSTPKPEAAGRARSPVNQWTRLFCR